MLKTSEHMKIIDKRIINSMQACYMEAGIGEDQG